MTEASLDAGQDTTLAVTEPIVHVEAVSPFAEEAAQHAEEPEPEGAPSDCRQTYLWFLSSTVLTHRPPGAQARCRPLSICDKMLHCIGTQHA